jgi:5'-nucleotidase
LWQAKAVQQYLTTRQIGAPMPAFPFRRRAAALAAAGALALAACGDDSDAGDDEAVDPGPDGTDAVDGADTGDAGDDVLRIHLTNDDGIGAPGLDAVAEGLASLDDVEVHIVAPAEDWSGGSDRRLEDVELEAEEMATASGTPGLGVNGMPADSVVWAHENYFGEEVGEPHLTVSGANGGQNLGELAYISGTVGAARESARHGVPALAVSQGFGGALEVTDYEELDYDAVVPHMLDWVEEHREALLAGELDTDTVANLNAPTCLEGEVRGLVETERQEAAPEGGPGPLDAADCTSDEDADDLNDVEAFVVGYVTLTSVDVEEPEGEGDEGEGDETGDEGDNGDASDDDGGD